MDSRVVILRGWKLAEDEYYNLINAGCAYDYEDYAHSGCWDDSGPIFLGDVIGVINQGYHMEMDNTNKLIFDNDACIMTGGITDPINPMYDELAIDCAAIGITPEHEVYGSPKTYLIHEVMI